MSVYVKALQRFLSETAGLAFDHSKLYLVESQLASLARERGHGSVDSLIAELQIAQDPVLTQRALEALTTHETFFFRDRAIFEFLRQEMLPRLTRLRSSQKRLRIWCAASATGQEPYSLAMLLDDEARRLHGWHIDILATDLSHQAMDVGRAGVYSQFEVQRGLPIGYLMRYFQRENDLWRLAEPIKARVHFRPLNLIQDFSRLGTFDIVLCRNMLIYCNEGARSDILRRLVPAVAEDGYLMLGATEALNGVGQDIQPLPFHSSIGVKATRQAKPAPLRLVARA